MKKPSDKIMPNTLGQRASRIRLAIMGILDERHCCTVDELIRFFPKEKPPHKTTVYRELELLTTAGRIRALNFGDGRQRFELTDGGHHHHLICTACGDSRPIVLADDLSDQALPYARRLGFRITDHALEFFGLCRKCRT